ncbi:MAG: twitching motility protein PilT [Spirochaetes bacterium GWD1_27_9]|nr:MAG: twitching motility protein PilT [Spirochaetes bacterium GWB1_27_13]OHD27853.1 MAG: twitching motility protein PilT [Spirochaetes bacterium GWC1_27_15]OHD30865.1 MAG: twitching motility protein PilT [Spirochaetes bacterium GWD1_27_9]
MIQTLIDTDILSLFFRNNDNVVQKFKDYITKFKKINISIITYYEILSGLKHRDAKKQLIMFEDFAKLNTIVPLTEESIKISSDIYSNLRKVGKPIDDIDILIAGVAIFNDFILVTNNEEHFKVIDNLIIENWSKKIF